MLPYEKRLSAFKTVFSAGRAGLPVGLRGAGCRGKDRGQDRDAARAKRPILLIQPYFFQVDDPVTATTLVAIPFQSWHRIDLLRARTRGRARAYRPATIQDQHS
jgi:hypothetical protein